MVRATMRACPGFGSLTINCLVLAPLVVLGGCGGQSTEESNAEPNVTSTQIAEQCLAAHNRVRAEVTAPAGYPGSWTALPSMVWSETVAASAQAWADYLKDPARNCALMHDSSSPYGENVAGGYVGFSPSMAVEAWAKDKPAFVFNPSYEFDNRWGHYSQLVWRNSTELGCAMAFCSGNGTNVVVCRYNPPGNVIGEQPY